MSHLVNVADLLADPGAARQESGSIPVSIFLPNASVDGEADFSGTIRSLSDGVVVRASAEVDADLICTRCLSEWTERRSVPFEQVYRLDPDDADDELPIVSGHSIDLEPAVHDEVSLAMPAAPVCREDCAGLCGVCGTDLNEAPCDGHDDPGDSPFAALKQLFDS